MTAENPGDVTLVPLHSNSSFPIPNETFVVVYFNPPLIEPIKVLTIKSYSLQASPGNSPSRAMWVGVLQTCYKEDIDFAT